MLPAPSSAQVLQWIVTATICTAALQVAQGSEGDASHIFRSCHASCMQTGCTKTPGNSNTCDVACPGRNSNYQAPFTLRLMQWDCTADCSYHCMWALEGPKAAESTGPVYKYYGKWPFVRVMGAQEIASVMFSILNMLAHLHNVYLYVNYNTSIQRPGTKLAGGSLRTHCGMQYSYYWLWIVYSLVNVNAWLWSTVFHCRDTKVTERFDYFSADLTIAVSVAVAVIRTLQLQKPLQLALLSLCIGSGLLQHIYYMAFIKFDYGYNMKVCITVGLATAVAWVVWATAVKHPARRVMYHFIILMHAAMLLEVLDFPPLWWFFDAHALWHAATVPLTYLWYKFVFADVAWLTQGVGGCLINKCSSTGSLAEIGLKQKQ